jgi:hypothetical protein
MSCKSSSFISEQLSIYCTLYSVVYLFYNTHNDIESWPELVIKQKYNYDVNIPFYPAMTAFTDQYSLPNIFFDIGQL